MTIVTIIAIIVRDIQERSHSILNICSGSMRKIEHRFAHHLMALNAQVVSSSASTNLSPKTLNDFIFAHTLHQFE